MTTSVFRLGPCKIHFQCAFFLQEKRRLTSQHKGGAPAIVEPKQEEASVSPGK